MGLDEVSYLLMLQKRGKSNSEKILLMLIFAAIMVY